MMKRLIPPILSALIALTAFANVPANLPNETLNYKVMFKWGLVNKQSGTAVLSLRNNGPQYIAKLTARSDSWVDHLFTVRDTLTTTINKQGFRPVQYDNIAHEGKDHKHDVVQFDYSSLPTVKANCVHTTVDRKDGATREQRISLSAQGVALDMLSMYYYMRYIDYSSLKKGQQVKLHIFSGRRKELLTITFHGYENLEYDKKKFNCFRISFTFTSDGGKKTSDDMDAWITTDSRRIPVKLAGKLKVGAVHCLYTGT